MLAKCCCCCTVKKGSIVLGVLGTIYPILSIIALAAGFSRSVAALKMLVQFLQGPVDDNLPTEEMDNMVAYVNGLVITFFVILIIVYAFDLLISILLIVGAVKNRKNFLLPWIITQGLSVILLVCVLITMMAKISWAMPQIVGVVSILVSILFNIYFGIVVYSHYQDLREQERREANAPAEMQTRLTSQM